jgi:hypothetical protein
VKVIHVTTMELVMIMSTFITVLVNLASKELIVKLVRKKPNNVRLAYVYRTNECVKL